MKKFGAHFLNQVFLALKIFKYKEKKQKQKTLFNLKHFFKAIDDNEVC
jgi:hypothetical protein